MDMLPDFLVNFFSSDFFGIFTIGANVCFMIVAILDSFEKQEEEEWKKK